MRFVIELHGPDERTGDEQYNTKAFMRINDAMIGAVIAIEYNGDRMLDILGDKRMPSILHAQNYMTITVDLLEGAAAVFIIPRDQITMLPIMK